MTLRSFFRPSVRRIRYLSQWLRWQGYWRLIIFLRLNNLIINRRVHSIDGNQISQLESVKRDKLNITKEDYIQFTKQPSLCRFSRFSFVHCKVLEYLTSFKLLNFCEESRFLDAAGGSGEYGKAVHSLINCRKNYCNDLLLAGKVEDGVEFIGGNITDLDLRDSSISAISCHHSFEHFKGDEDKKFVLEIVRLLVPGGRACIVPIFLVQEYVETWNIRPLQKFDSTALTVYDPFGAFPGWGKYDRFARAYSLEAFFERILKEIPSHFEVTIFDVFYEGEPCPEINFWRNHHQAHINRNMRALVIQRIQ